METRSTSHAQFLFDHSDVPGAESIEGRRIVALQAQAREMAQTAVENELILAPAEPETVGILPFVVDGDEAYQPLSVGLAHMLTTDLALLRRFPIGGARAVGRTPSGTGAS